MGAGTELKITHTYRNSQELIDIAGSFVQKNSAQIRKQLISPKHLENPVVIETFDNSAKPMKALAEKVENIIGKIIAEYGEKSTILLIGRYNFDMYKLYKTGMFKELPNNRVKSEKYSVLHLNLPFLRTVREGVPAVSVFIRIVDFSVVEEHAPPLRNELINSSHKRHTHS